MKISDNFKLIGILTLVVVGLGACDKPGPAESAGKKIDQAADNAGRQISEASDKVATGMAQQSEKAGVVVDDTEITTKVKAAIFAEPGLKSLQISVATVKGVVTLSGSVDTQLNSDMAKTLAGAVSGVNRVKNHLVVKSHQ